MLDGAGVDHHVERGDEAVGNLEVEIDDLLGASRRHPRLKFPLFDVQRTLDGTSIRTGWRPTPTNFG